MNNLKECLMYEARAKGICAEGYEDMRTRTLGELINYYIANPDWCLERDFPDIKTLKLDFADCEHAGIYVGKRFEGELLNERQTYIFHDCEGAVKVGLNVEKGIIPMLYVANGCRMNFVGAGEVAVQRPSVVPVYVFGKNEVTTEDNEYATFNLYENELI